MESRLNDIHLLTNDLLTQLQKELEREKEDFIKVNNQEKAKQIWVYQAIIEVHKHHKNAYNLLIEKSYYQAWCQLERIEIAIAGLKKHFAFDKKQYFLWHIEKSTKNLQVIFPYRLFASSELLKKRKECSVCKKEISIRNPCGHIIGEIYDGEMCHRNVTEAEVLGISLVQNPGNKYSVMFLKDEKTDEQVDQYNYDTIDYLFEHINSPYELWDLEVSQREIKKSDFRNIGRNDKCTCNSGKKFKKCCGEKIGDKYPHYGFILINPSDKTLLTNTLKASR
jgi:hypothetical protein